MIAIQSIPVAVQQAEHDTTDSGFNGELMDDVFSHENSFCTKNSYPFKGSVGTFQKYSSNGVQQVEKNNAVYQRFFGPNREVWEEQAHPFVEWRFCGLSKRSLFVEWRIRTMNSKLTIFVVEMF